MANTLLQTKLYIPPSRPNLITRPKLTIQLDHSLETGTKLTLISAPAGYGKTTSLAQWARSTRFPIGWLSLDRSDNDFERFFRYLVRAWAEVQPGVLDSRLSTLLGSMSPNSEAVLAAFVNAANEVPDHTGLILDDYHLIEEPHIHEALIFVLDHLPPKFHFLLASRGEPPLPLARYRARDELKELGVAELRFMPAETQVFLNERMGLRLSADQIEPLQANLEGWIAGLQLVSLALRRGLTRVDQVASGGRQRFISDYLHAEVLAKLPQATRDFLLQTSILDRLCSPLCEAVTGGASGQEILETIEREGLFLNPLDDRREWFCYHPPFAEFLVEELKHRQPEMVADLHRRAARWYLEEGLIELAFHHAVAGQDDQTVVRIAERHFDFMLHTGNLKVLRRWLDELPEEWQVQYPVIGLTQASLLAMTGAVDACLHLIGNIEEALIQSARKDQRWQLARVNTVRCQIACFQHDLAKAEPLAVLALQDLPDIDHHYRANIHQTLGEAYQYVGRWREAREQYHKALALVKDPAFRFRSTHVYGALADVERRQGQLRAAAKYWDKSLSVIEERDTWGNYPLPLIGWVYIRMAEIQYEWNELPKAAELIELGLERAELGGAVQAMIAGNLIAGRLQLTQGDLEAAALYLEKARTLVENAQFPYWSSRFERLQVELWLAHDELRMAAAWCDEMLQGDKLAIRTQNEMGYLAITRVLIVKGDPTSLKKALNLLEQLENTAEAQGRTAVRLEALALEALAYQKRGNESEAMTAIEEVLRLAEPEGYCRLFIDLGLSMARLLQRVRDRKVIRAYTTWLLTAFGDDWMTVERISLPEPLTGREAEILKLIAAGLTNREIATRLFISPETVKKHAGNIYGKLNVSSRIEAAVLARRLGLLD